MPCLIHVWESHEEHVLWKKWHKNLFILKIKNVHSDSCLIFSFHVILSAKCDSQAGSDSASKKPQMLRTPNGYKCLTCNRVFSQKGEHDTKWWLLDMWQADVRLQPALTVTFQCFGNINVRNTERPKSALGNSLQCFFRLFFYKIQTQKGSKECLFIMTWTHNISTKFFCFCFYLFEWSKKNDLKIWNILFVRQCESTYPEGFGFVVGSVA